MILKWLHIFNNKNYILINYNKVLLQILRNIQLEEMDTGNYTFLYLK